MKKVVFVVVIIVGVALFNEFAPIRTYQDCGMIPENCPIHYHVSRNQIKKMVASHANE